MSALVAVQAFLACDIKKNLTPCTCCDSSNCSEHRKNLLVFLDVLGFLGPAVHTGGKPHAVFQGGDECLHPGRADLPPPVWPKEEEGVGPPLWVCDIYILSLHVFSGKLQSGRYDKIVFLILWLLIKLSDF